MILKSTQMEMILGNKSIKPLHFPNVGVLEVTLTDEAFDFVKQCIQDKGNSLSKTLVGNIDSSYELHDKDNWFYDNVLKENVTHYSRYFTNLGSSVPTTKTHDYVLDAWWVNYQKKHEFNPLHNHTGVYSFVIWVKIPTEFEKQHDIQLKKGIHPQGAVAGDFEFEYTNIIGNHSSFVYNMGQYIEGKMVFFPSELRHCVYPFYECDKERVSVSGNICLGT